MANVPDVSAHRMRTFLAVVETGSVRAAAAQLHVSEPAVSSALAQLATQLDATLFVRSGRGLQVTTAGEAYAGYCRSILGLMAQAHAALHHAEDGPLRIGAVATASEVVLPPVLAGFRRRFPRVALSLDVAPRDKLVDLLGHHQVDVVVGGRPPHGSGLVSVATRRNTLVVVRAPEHDDDPSRATWLLRGEGSGVRHTTLDLLRRLELDPPTLTLGTHGAVVASVRASLGMTLVHTDAVAADLAGGRLVTVDLPSTPLERPWVVATNPTTTPTTRLFLGHLTRAEQPADERFHPANPTHG